MPRNEKPTPRQEDVRIGQKLHTYLSTGKRDSIMVWGTVTRIVVTANECYAVVQTNERDALGLRVGRTNLFRTRPMHRCKLDASRENGLLPVCPLASRTCHSPCDILARAHGPIGYPDVIWIPE